MFLCDAHHNSSIHPPIIVSVAGFVTNFSPTLSHSSSPNEQVLLSIAPKKLKELRYSITMRAAQFVKLILLVTFPNFTLSLDSNAFVNQSVVYTNFEDDVEIHCYVPSNHPITTPATMPKMCRFYLTPPEGKRIIVNITEPNNEVKQEGPGNYSYVGKGIKMGHCGLKMRSIQQNQIGRWVCSIISPSQSWLGTVDVVKFVPPEPPIITVNGTSVSVINVTDAAGHNKTKSIKCCANGGKPIEETKLLHFLGGHLVNGTELKKNDSQGGDNPTTCIQSVITFTKEDNEKPLDCRVFHPGFGNEYDEESIFVNVNYAAEIMFETTEVNDTREFITQVTYQKDEVTLSFNGRGNPTPDVSVDRMVDDNGNWTATSIKQIEIHDKDNYFEFVITLPFEGQNVTYNITLHNELGSDAAGTTIVTPKPEEEESNDFKFWLLVGIGIAMSIAFVVIILCIGNSVAKKQGWLWYVNRIGRYSMKKQNSRNSDNSNHALKSEAGHEHSTVGKLDEASF